MTILEFFLVAVPSLLIGALAMLFVFKNKKKPETAGDLHIFPTEDGYTACYVAWETEPENLIGENYVLLKVLGNAHSQE